MKRTRSNAYKVGEPFSKARYENELEQFHAKLLLICDSNGFITWEEFVETYAVMQKSIGEE